MSLMHGLCTRHTLCNTMPQMYDFFPMWQNFLKHFFIFFFAFFRTQKIKSDSEYFSWQKYN